MPPRIMRAGIRKARMREAGTEARGAGGGAGVGLKGRVGFVV